MKGMVKGLAPVSSEFNGVWIGLFRNDDPSLFLLPTIDASTIHFSSLLVGYYEINVV